MTELAYINEFEGEAVIFSDAHYWPGRISLAHKALVKVIEQVKPRLVVANGDLLDGARIGKHARIGWEKAPKLVDELSAVRERLHEVEAACPSFSRLLWPLGNHDARFETYLANNVPEYAGVDGFTLKEHFPAWEPCWGLVVNRRTVIKHRWKGGKTATLKNTIEAGINIFTGHLHSLRVSPYSDYTGTRFGVDTGTLADPYGPQFANYTEMNPVDWRSGFVVATWRGGELLWPEVVEVRGETVWFRGERVL